MAHWEAQDSRICSGFERKSLKWQLQWGHKMGIIWQTYVVVNTKEASLPWAAFVILEAATSILLFGNAGRKHSCSWLSKSKFKYRWGLSNCCCWGYNRWRYKFFFFIGKHVTKPLKVEPEPWLLLNVYPQELLMWCWGPLSFTEGFVYLLWMSRDWELVYLPWMSRDWHS